MIFVLSKVLSAVLLPSSLCWIMLATGLVMLRWPRREWLGRRLAWGGFGALLVLGYSPLANWIIAPLEARFATSEAAFGSRLATVGKPRGIIVLGGFEDGRVTRARGGLHVNEAGDRLIATIRLAHALPDARVVFTGGRAALLLSAADAGDGVQDFLIAAGIAPDRIVIERESRDTWENAVLTREQIGEVSGTWLLVTSAWHMPRAVGAFRKAGFDVVAWPTDFRTADGSDRWRPFPRLPDGLKRMDMAVNEWLGLIVYRATGRSSSLLPGPVGSGVATD